MQSDHRAVSFTSLHLPDLTYPLKSLDNVCSPSPPFPFTGKIPLSKFMGDFLVDENDEKDDSYDNAYNVGNNGDDDDYDDDDD